MAQKPKYPKKLRVKLEKMAADREAKASEDTFSDMFDTMWHRFLPRDSVHFMHARFDDVLRRFETVYHLEAGLPPDRCTIKAPWLRDETASSS